MTLRSSPFVRAGLAGAALCTLLAGCAPLVIGGAAATAMLVTDRRTAGTVLEDERIELRSVTQLHDAFGDRAHINVASYNRQALLTGEVPDEAAKQRAEQIVARVENVKGVVNDLAVLGTTTLGQRSNDSLITGKVKASLVDASDLQANAFKVITERGTVYLLGRVTQREANRATQIARTVDGVQRVVRVFEYIDEEQLKRESAPAPSTPPTVPRS